MTTIGTAAFLQQAHRNNWQRYLASLQAGARRGWDVCILTASDERQAAMYRRQLDWRREAGLLPTRTRFQVLADPRGQRIGSGGATLRALATLTADSSSTASDGQRALIIHSGGDSRRLPHCSAIGKLFARVPRVLPDGRASTIFDEFLIGLSGLSTEVPAGALIASGDVLLIFDHLQLTFRRTGVIGVAAAAPADMGRRHGVYVDGGGGHRVRAYLHKAAADDLARWAAVDADGTVQIDTGLVWLDDLTVHNLVSIAHEDPLAGIDVPREASTAASSAVNLNLYGDLLLPLAQSTTYEGYLADTSDGPATPAVQMARQVIWERLRGTPFTVERLQPAAFIHFGTSFEYWRMVAADPDLARLCDWTIAAAAWRNPNLQPVAQPDIAPESSLVLINSAAGGADRPGEAALVVDSHLDGSFAWSGAAIVAGVRTAQSLNLQRNVVVHQMPISGGGFVTRIFGLRDDPKRALDDPAATLMNQPWAQWLLDAADLIWPGLPLAARTLWNACLYPVATDREESLRLSLPLQDPAHASLAWQAQWQAAARLSLAESFAQADGERILADVAEVEDYVAARRFYAAIVAEQPAAEARKLLGMVESTVMRRCQQVAGWLAEADPILRMRGYKALAVATGDSRWEDRAFATLARMIEESVQKV